jgi:hypothetical protein
VHRMAQTTPGIAAGRTWVFFVRHSHNRRWEFLPLRHIRNKRRVSVPFERLLVLDPTLRALSNLRPGWTAHRRTPHDEWERLRMPVGPTHFLRFEAVPVEGSADSGKGAFINCWVRDPLKRSALRTAKKHILKAGWRPTYLEKHNVVRRLDVRPAGRKYFDQVQIDGWVLIIHCFPAGT